MRLLSTGIKKLDRAIGGGILPNTNVLILNNTYSTGWAIAFEILKNRVQMGDFGVITNTAVPLSSLEIELIPVGVDIKALGKSGNLAVIDIFGSLHGIRYNEDFVHSGNHFSVDTFVPKYSMLFDIFSFSSLAVHGGDVVDTQRAIKQESKTILKPKIHTIH
ncbi:ATPase domain-containing protein [Thermococcus eurythermalis]|uniref:ATPase domain-containing protein n=1 Tax=Thermococcus eurythermalis TaxID=1505907 RepID=UPI00067899C2|nr:ATPase domain-containing protein [Thermococcus eurythermalis]